MVIIKENYGRLANRLWQFSYLIAFGIENNVYVSYPGFKEYAKYFLGTQNNLFCSFPSIELPILIPEFLRSIIFKSVPWLKRFFIKLKLNQKFYSHIWIKPGVYFDMDDKLSKQKLLNAKVVTLEGWLTRCNISFRNNEELIRKIFTPNENYFSKPIKMNNNNTVIGVHMRQKQELYDDNESFFYLNNGEYREIMLKCIELYDDCSFVLISNLPIDKNYFADLPVFYTNAHFIQDLYTLTTCNYIVGVSSTFSLWASFYEQVPLCMITSNNQKISQSSFKVYHNLF